MADLAAKAALNKSVTPLLIPYSDYKAGIRTYIRDLMQKKRDTQIRTCATTEELKNSCSEMSDWLIDLGYCKPTTSLDILQLNEILRSLVQTYIYYRVHAEIQQFTSGLNVLGLWDVVMSAPNTFEPLFVEADGPLTLRQLNDMYRVELSPRGSNKRLEENDTMFAWEDLLRACDRDMEISIVDVLQFRTGSNRIPPMGFDKNSKSCLSLKDNHHCYPHLWPSPRTLAWLRP